MTETPFVKPSPVMPDEELTREQMIFRLDLQRGIIEARQRGIEGKAIEIEHLESVIKDIRQGRTLANIRADRAEAEVRKLTAQLLTANARF